VSATGYLNQAFLEASQRHYSTYEKWVNISARVGSRLPASLLMANIQRHGRLDLLLRQIEDEVHTGLSQEDIFAADYLSMLSEVWIGGTYEVFRLLRQRKLADDTKLFRQILKLLELLRMPMEKHEIAKDNKLSEPLILQRQPANEDTSDSYEYLRTDDTRAHIMPASISTVNGSMMWQAIDLQNNSAY
jgi:hypothetical protein